MNLKISGAPKSTLRQGTLILPNIKALTKAGAISKTGIRIIMWISLSLVMAILPGKWKNSVTMWSG